MENEGAVTQDTGSATVESDNSTPDVGSTPDQGQVAQQAGRTYSEDQVNAMIRGRIEQQKRSYEKRLSEYQQNQAKYEQAVTRMNSGIEAMGRGFGFIQDQQADPISEKFSASDTALNCVPPM